MASDSTSESPASALTRYGTVHCATDGRAPPDVVHPDPDCRALDQTDSTRRVEHPGALPLRCSVCEQCFEGGSGRRSADD
jgi:hypothetical protein